MLEKNIYCFSVARPADAVLTPLTAPLADSYAEYILNEYKTWAQAGVERSDEEREGAPLEA